VTKLATALGVELVLAAVVVAVLWAWRVVRRPASLKS